VRIEPDAFLGMAAVIRDHLTVGAGAVVGMGAVVLSNVATGSEVRGVPARPHRTTT
jgi:acetyltransferase EpsM